MHLNPFKVYKINEPKAKPWKKGSGKEKHKNNAIDRNKIQSFNNWVKFLIKLLNFLHHLIINVINLVENNF